MKNKKLKREIHRIMENIEKMKDNYEERKVADKIVVEGLCVSTALTADCGYETAILDKNGTHVVERYKTKEDAIKGHYRWRELARTVEKVTALRCTSLIPDNEVILERVPAWSINKF